MVKLNSYGAIEEGNIAGCGGVVRDERGDGINGFSKHLGAL